MNSDQHVSSQIILHALMQVRRQGTSLTFQKLEQMEPQLAGFMKENLSLLNAKLQEFGNQHRQTRRLYREFEAFAVVLVESVKTAHYQLWKSEALDGPLATLEADLLDDLNVADDIDLHPPYGSDDPHPG